MPKPALDEADPALNLLTRADGDAVIGTGHVMRCIALSEAWRRVGGTAAVATASSSPAVMARIERAGLPVHGLPADPGSLADAELTIGLARQLGATWLVTDGYRFDDDYQRRIHDAGIPLLVIDDYGHAASYSGDMILNQNLSAREDWYARRGPDVSLLLGPQFALLRSEFLAYSDWHRSFPDRGRRVLVTLGGSDPTNVTAKVLAALDELDLGLEVRTIIGGDYRHSLPVAAAIRDARNMPELMAWADVAVAAGGTTAWELAYMGLPSITLVLADNQVDLAASLDGAGLSQNLGMHSVVDANMIAMAVRELVLDRERRSAMSGRGRKTVDGRGADRVVTELLAATRSAAEAHEA